MSQHIVTTQHTLIEQDQDELSTTSFRPKRPRTNRRSSFFDLESTCEGTESCSHHSGHGEHDVPPSPSPFDLFFERFGDVEFEDALAERSMLGEGDAHPSSGFSIASRCSDFERSIVDDDGRESPLLGLSGGGGGSLLPHTPVDGEIQGDAVDDLGEFGDVLPDTDSANFRFQGKCFHLTYRGHLDRNAIFAIFGGEHMFKYWSCVHERGTHKREGGEPYDHTHFFGLLGARITRQGARCFDVAGIHPYIQKVSSKIHQGRLYWLYHRKDPIALWQSKEAPQDPTLLLDKERKRAAIFQGSLLDAAEQLQIEIRNFGDLKAIREERVPAAPAESNYPADSFNYALTWMHSYHGRVFETACVYLYGGAGLGKTEFALSQFKRPLLVRSLDQARDYHPERYDGLVFDDANIHHLKAEAKIHLADYSHPAVIQCRFMNANIGKGVRRIFTSNKSPEDFWRGPDMTLEQFEAIKRRVKFVHICNSLFN